MEFRTLIASLVLLLLFCDSDFRRLHRMKFPRSNRHIFWLRVLLSNDEDYRFLIRLYRNLLQTLSEILSIF